MSKKAKVKEWGDRVAILRSKRAQIEADITDLEIKLARANSEGLPTVPGFYESDDGIARLGSDGIWDDGWGNPYLGDDLVDLADTTLRRLVPADE